MGIVGPCALVVMAKAPRPGQVKTRLRRRYSDEDVVEIYRALVEDTLRMARAVPDVHVSMVCPAGHGDELRAWLSDLQVEEQIGRGLADALSTTFSIFGEQGFGRIIALNCDTPHLPSQLIRDAFDVLRTRQLVVGPTLDGGYYLVGGSSWHPALFDESSLGTAGARETLLKRATEMGLDVGYTDACYDVDVPEDLERLGRELTVHPERAPRTAAWLARARTPLK